MKKWIVMCLLLVSSATVAYCQQITSASLIGTWDQQGGKHPATMLFLDSGRIRYSYKGHSGSSKTYYYLLNTSQDPALLTVDYSQKHKKHRNEYLVQLIDKDTIKLQVLFKKDSRQQFTPEPAYKTVTLVRRKAL